MHIIWDLYIKSIFLSIHNIQLYLHVQLAVVGSVKQLFIAVISAEVAQSALSHFPDNTEGNVEDPL